MGYRSRKNCFGELFGPVMGIKSVMNYPPAQNRYMQEKIIGELIFPRIHAGPVFALARRQKNILRSHFLHISQILEGNYFGAYTCRACIRTRANTGKYSWGIIYVLVSCQGVISGSA